MSLHHFRDDYLFTLARAAAAREAKDHLAVLMKLCLRLSRPSHLLRAHLQVHQELCALWHILQILRVTAQRMNPVSFQPTTQQLGINLPNRRNRSSPPRVALPY